MVRLDAVLAAVRLHDQQAFEATEVGDVRAQGPLPAEFMPAKTARAQLVPECPFGIGRVAAQRSSVRADGSADDPHGCSITRRRPSPNPLPQAGEGFRIAPPRAHCHTAARGITSFAQLGEDEMRPFASLAGLALLLAPWPAAA